MKKCQKFIGNKKGKCIVHLQNNNFNQLQNEFIPKCIIVVFLMKYFSKFKQISLRTLIDYNLTGTKTTLEESRKSPKIDFHSIKGDIHLSLNLILTDCNYITFTYESSTFT